MCKIILVKYISLGMGYCCSKENKSDMVDPKEEKLGVIELKKEDEILEKGGNQPFQVLYDETPEDMKFKNGASKIRSTNTKTNEVYEEQGPYVYEYFQPDGIKRILSDLIIMENGDKYYGFLYYQIPFIILYRNAETKERDGKGVMIWLDGSRYDGYWNSDKTHGKGRLIHANGDVYTGDWQEGKANGKGLYVHSDGASYNGEWKDDKQHGVGVEMWPDGAKYEGSYLNGMKHGQGCFTWADGSEYKGEFSENNIHGKGFYKWTDGREYIGDWRNNKMHGHGMFKWSDGRIYDGEYFEDAKEGLGTFIWYFSVLNIT